MLVAGIAGFKSWRAVENPSASFLRDWIEHATFTWLVSEDPLAWSWRLSEASLNSRPR